MAYAILILILTQLLFSAGDLMGRQYMSTHGFHLATFLSAWFILYLAIRIIATIGQLYVFSSLELGKTITLFAVTGLLLANLLGFLVLKEVLSPATYVGVVFAILAFVIIAFAK